MAEFIREIERAAAPRKRAPSKPAANDVVALFPVPARPKPFVVQVEDYVLGNPDGVTVEDVSSVTGQSERSAYGTLRHAERTRGTLAHRSDGRWYPTGKAATERPSDKTVRDYITAAPHGQPAARDGQRLRDHRGQVERRDRDRPHEGGRCRTEAP